MKTSFHTKLLQFGNNTGIEVPETNLAELGAGKRPLVIVTVNGYTYPGAIAGMSGKSLISFAKAHRDISGIQGGDEIEVTLEVDTSSRKTIPPKDASDALKAANVEEAYSKLAPSRQKEYIRQITEAKKPETRANRINKMIEELRK